MGCCRNSLVGCSKQPHEAGDIQGGEATCSKLRISWVVLQVGQGPGSWGPDATRDKGTPPEADSALGPAPTHICFQAAICPDVAGGATAGWPPPSRPWVSSLSFLLQHPGTDPLHPFHLDHCVPVWQRLWAECFPSRIHAHSLASKM